MKIRHALTGSLPALLITFFAIFTVGNLPAATGQGKAQRTEFDFHKGINISAWLSQTRATNGQARRDYFTRKDVHNLSALGFDHIRLPIDEKQLYDDNGHRNEETFSLIHDAISWCREADMRLILDYHVFRNKDAYIWSHPEEQDHIIGRWKELSAEFGRYPNELLAYELFNEPRVPDPQLWNEFSTRLIGELRKTEPSRIIFLASNRLNSVSTFKDLTFPEDDPNIILSFHFYTPSLLTHYQANFMPKLKDVEVELTYPGKLISDKAREDILDEDWVKIRQYQGTYNKETLLRRIMPAIEKARESGLRIHCGEFGSNYMYPDPDLQYRWIKDMVDIFRENDIPYTVWGYKFSFGIYNHDGTIKDRRIVDALTR